MIAGEIRADPTNVRSNATIVPIGEHLLEEVLIFLHEHMRPQVAVEHWRETFCYPWLRTRPNYGYALCHCGHVVGVQGICYSMQRINGRTERYCNLHSWCVHPNYRRESLRLLLTAIRQEGCTITTFTASKATVPIMKMFGFTPLDDQVIILPNPLLAFGAWRVRISLDPDAILAGIDADNRNILAELGPMSRARARIAQHGEDWCLCLSVRERRRSLSVVRVIYVSHPVLFAAWASAFARSFFVTDASPLTTCPARFLPHRPLLSGRFVEPRPAFFKSSRLTAGEVTYLYSELTR
jgi:hypothetical protein